MSCSKPSITRRATLFFKIKGCTFRGNLIYESFMKFKKCSFSTMIFCLINSKEKILGVRNAGKMYGSCTKPYTLVIMCSFRRNHPTNLMSGLNCNTSSISGSTLGRLSWKITRYIYEIMRFISLKVLFLIS